MHNPFCIVGGYHSLDGVAVALLYALESVPISLHLPHERECLAPAIELPVATKSVGVIFGLANVNEERIDILVPFVSVVAIFSSQAHCIENMSVTGIVGC